MTPSGVPTNAPGGVEFKDVSLTLPGTTAFPSRDLLTNINLELPAGSVTALLGRSGSGKTTLLRMVNGLIKPTAGTVTVDGATVSASTADRLLELRHGVGYVIQETGLYPHMTVERNAGMALELAGQSAAERRPRVTEMLNLVGLDSSFAPRMPWQLSGGQRQRVGLARALAADPSILLLDEPFGALDPLTRAEMQTFLGDLLGRLKKTAIIVTHDLQEALYLAERVLFIGSGKVVADLAACDVEHSTLPHVQEYLAAVHRSPHTASDIASKAPIASSSEGTS